MPGLPPDHDPDRWRDALGEDLSSVDPEVFAAGGVVTRSVDGAPEILVVHRPKYDDWSLPKGKLDEGEDFADAAIREIEEETAVSCRLGRELSSVRYLDPKGRPKLVRYWHMIPLDGHPDDRDADREIDDVRWVPVDDARTLLSYPHDVELLDQALGAS